MADQDNKREATRLHHELPVAYRSVGSFLSDWATNISEGGLFINTRKPLPVGTEVKILVQIPGAAFPYELHGAVARVTEFDNAANMVPGMGIQFIGLDDAKKREIDEFVTRLRREFGEG
jgi:uncharacterized protein (TIGR02266 family)